LRIAISEVVEEQDRLVDGTVTGFQDPFQTSVQGLFDPLVSNGLGGLGVGGGAPVLEVEAEPQYRSNDEEDRTDGDGTASRLPP
jgi:hypothetical protein